MVDQGSFVLLSTFGGVQPTEVTVPGNAAAIVARAVALPTLFTATVIDADTVMVTFPSELTVDQLFTLASQMTSSFHEVGEGELGWLTVTARGILGLADSADEGSAPDYIPVVGTVTLTPTRTPTATPTKGLLQPIRVISTGQFLVVATVTATFDSDGELSYDETKNVRLIAPKWDQLSDTEWEWRADIRPGPGQNWAGWSVHFSGAPGDVVNLASLLA